MSTFSPPGREKGRLAGFSNGRVTVLENGTQRFIEILFFFLLDFRHGVDLSSRWLRSKERRKERKETVTRPRRSVKLIPLLQEGEEREIPGKNGTRIRSSPPLFPSFLQPRFMPRCLVTAFPLPNRRRCVLVPR